ncbi:MAG: cytochrome c [Novosphingobium sp.]
MTRAGLLIVLALAACSKGQQGGTLPADFKLTSVSVTMPDASSETFPAGPGAEAMNANCASCHSPAMVLVQPPLSHEDWVKSIDKMRKVYKAPIAEADVPAILGYLDALSAGDKR